jgi:predicted ATP-dependent endonuclease of OLD family
MRIKSVRIRNFRSFRDQSVEFNPYTCFVGPNGAGKSAVLCALNVFFREVRDVATNLQLLHEEDFHNRNIKEPVQITVSFTDLSTEAQSDFKHYYRQGELTITATATFDEQSKRAEVMQHGERLVMKEFSDFFSALNDGQLVAKLKDIYLRIRELFTDLPAPGTKDVMTSALRAFETAHSDRCTLVPSPDQFYGFSKGTNLLQKHVEWVYVPAVKDVTTEQLENRSNTFGRLVSRAVRTKIQFGDDLKSIRQAAQVSYQNLLEKGAPALEELSKALQTRVAQWAHPDARVHLKWEQDQEKSVSVQEPLVRILAGEGNFLGELARFGHGLQRSYLLALLQELSTVEGAEGPTLVLACEEPELYQHPPQARHLASVLTQLSQHGSQVIVSTHSPLFVAGDVFEDVRLVRKDSATGESSVKYARYEAVATRLAAATGKPVKKREGMAAIMHRALQPGLNEIFFANRVVLVEGIEDAAYVAGYLHLLERWEEFRRRGQHLVVTNGKSNMVEPVTVILELGLPAFVVLDADGSTEKEEWRKRHELDNIAILRALGVKDPAPFPKEVTWGPQHVIWPDCLAQIVSDEIGAELWNNCQLRADAEWGHAGNLRKNPLHIGSSLRGAWSEGGRSKILQELCERILA